MNLNEFESKKILFDYNLPILNSYLTNKFFYIKKSIYKIQVDSNYRKKGGGILIPHNFQDLYLYYQKWKINKFNNKTIKYFLIEKITKIDVEFYISFYIYDYNLILLLSNKGGINIELENKNKFLKINIKILIIFYSVYDYLINCKICKININKILNLLLTIYKIIIKEKFLLIEINPLIIYKKNIYILDCKIIKEGFLLKNFSDKISNILKLNYIQLNGNICCIVNGAGLALQTLDVLSFNNLKCFNFIDLSGSITEEYLNNLIKLILINKKIKILFINIFGGIVSCEKILFGILNIFYYSFNFKIIIKLSGLKSKFVLKKILFVKNIILINSYKKIFNKCLILND